MFESVRIHGEEYLFIKEVRENTDIRKSFCRLANEIFCLDFLPWYESGGWKDDYIPYVLVQDGKVVANVSVNRTPLYDGAEEKLYVQIGTVMTRSDKRRKGLGRFLMERVLDDWRGCAEGIYLFGNDSVKEYYPLFGFSRSYETGYSLCLEEKGKGRVRRLNMEEEADREIARRFTARSNSHTALDMRNNPGLLWFYFSGPFCSDLYYYEEGDALLVQYLDGSTLFVEGIQGGDSMKLLPLLQEAALPGAKRIQLGFTPVDKCSAEARILEVEDTTLFVLKHDPFGESGLRLPALAHA